MPVFRVHGIDRDGNPTSIDVECGGEAVARNTAERRGLVKTTSVEIVERSDPETLVRPEPPKRVRLGPVTLDGQSVLTIAAGVFLGLLAWTVFSFAVGLVLRAVSGEPGW